MWIVSVCCLVFVAAMCVVGTLSRAYDDNLVQRVGMACICLGVLAKANEVWVFEAVPVELLIAHIGLALFAAGTTFKVWLRQMEARARKRLWPETVPVWPEIDDSSLPRISGGRR